MLNLKQRLLTTLTLLTAIFLGATAQTKAYDAAFVNAKGEILAPNTTLHLNEVEDSPFVPGQKQMATRLFVRNTSGTKQAVKLSYTLLSIDEGELQVCAFGECTIQSAAGTYTVGAKTIEVNAARDESVEIEHNFATKGKCTATLRITTQDASPDGTSAEKEGPQLTLLFDTDHTGIADAVLHDDASCEMFNTQGVLVRRGSAALQTLPQGIYIVRQRSADGRFFSQKYTVR